MTHPVSLRAIVAAAALFGGMTVAQAQETIFYSTQLRPIEEATKVRDVLLKGIPGKVTYVVDEPPAFAVRMKAETQAGKRTASVVGALHGELQPHVPADLQPVDDVAAKLTDRVIPASLMDLGKLGTGQQQYIPWMQATYVMVANKQALQYLPAGADVNSLTYTQLQQWGKNIVDKTGQRRLGFPAGPTGLLPRFFQGYFYPSFTGGVVTTFKSADAEAGTRGGHLVFPRCRDPIIAARFLAGEKLLVLSARVLIHHIEVAIEVGAELETHNIVLRQHQAGINRLPGVLVEFLQDQLHAVRALVHGA